MDGRYLFPPFQLPAKMVPYVHLLQVRVGDWVLDELHRAVIVLEHRYARHAHIRQHETLNLPQKQRFLNDVCKRHMLYYLRGRKCGALLGPVNPRHTTSTHDGPHNTCCRSPNLRSLHQQILPASSGPLMHLSGT